MEETIYTILTGIISTVLFELIKAGVLFLKVRKEEKNSTFDINGYWYAQHGHVDKFDNINYEAFELVRLKYRKGTITLKIYQLINDGRHYVFRGNGLIKFDKIVASYGEISGGKSDFLGTMMLRFSNVVEHSVVLEGTYQEFRRNNMKSTSYNYMLREYPIKRIQKLAILFRGEKYIFNNLLKSERDNKDCKNAM